MFEEKIAIIGAGAMGGAIAEGILKSGVVPAANLVVTNRSKEKLERFASRGAKVTTNNREAVESADIVVLAVKPWLVESVLGEFSDILSDEKTLVSVAAGVDSTSLRTWAGDECSLFMAIPNIAIAQLTSMTFLTPVDVIDEKTQVVKNIFDEMGKTYVCEEQQLSVGMALASCGIAYAFRYIRAAMEGGVELGFRAAQSQEIVMQTLKGAVTLLESEGLHPEQAIDQVTTPGGFTIRGLNAMEQAGFTSSVIQGLRASVHQ